MSTSVIYKYPLIMGGPHCHYLPLGSQVLAVGNQFESLFMWVRVDPRMTESTAREFISYGTGQEFEDHSGELEFIGTVQFNGGNLIYHVFEKVDNRP